MIEVKNLSKNYGSHTAVKDLSFTVESGQVYGFLGPNGAGKSTTMNIITGCLAATQGQVLIDGYDIFDNPKEAKKKIGYLPELPPVYPDMSVYEYLLFVARAKGVAKAEIKAQVDAVMTKTGISDVSRRIIKVLSKGYRQRVGIAQALLGDPETIILDEPMVGLDPKQIIEMRELIRQLGTDHTVILSSHILSEISAICDRVMIISKGRLVAVDTPENLARVGEEKRILRLTVKGDADAVKEAVCSVDGVSEAELTSSEDGCVSLDIGMSGDTDCREAIFYRLADAKMPILAMQINKVSLEDIFLDLTSDKAEDETEVQEVEADEGDIQA